MKVLISAGHSDRDPGAEGNGIHENEYCRWLRNQVATDLQVYATNFTVVTDGTWFQNLDLRSAIKLAQSCDIAVEFHLNASSNKKATGIEVLAHPKNKAFSKLLGAAIAEPTGLVLRGEQGWKSSDSGQHSRLGFVEAGGIIVECGFISNKQDVDSLCANFNYIAKALAITINNEVQDRLSNV